jgi:hypothetical protein
LKPARTAHLAHPGLQLLLAHVCLVSCSWCCCMASFLCTISNAAGAVAWPPSCAPSVVGCLTDSDATSENWSSKLSRRKNVGGAVKPSAPPPKSPDASMAAANSGSSHTVLGEPVTSPDSWNLQRRSDSRPSVIDAASAVTSGAAGTSFLSTFSPSKAGTLVEHWQVLPACILVLHSCSQRKPSMERRLGKDA